jgi:hypothetical protein
MGQMICFVQYSVSGHGLPGLSGSMSSQGAGPYLSFSSVGMPT